VGRQSIANERRDQILSGLYECLTTTNFGDVTIKQIAARADVAPSILHHYFENKDEIYSALALSIRDRYERLLNDYLESLPRSANRRNETLAFIVDQFILDRALNRVFYNLVLKSLENDAVCSPMRALLDTYRDRLEVEFDSAIDGAMIVAQVEGLALQNMIDPKRFSRDELIAMLTGQLGVRATNETTKRRTKATV
jgi:AcrR family transcriptional regulator